ncbi:MAG: hypothetical protein KY449_08285 [Proteobacteria bacterium]|nr:hypothetical protein [Pseudomonadota bacterium]
MPVSARHLGLCLLLLRLGVGLVMGMWTIDKMINPDHAGAVFSNFYGLEGLGAGVIVAAGAVQAAVVAAFLLGAYRTLSYGAVLVMHAGTTLSSWKQYLAAFDNLLFFAAWPMLAACVALFLLRSHDRLLSVDAWRLRHTPASEPS